MDIPTNLVTPDSPIKADSVDITGTPAMLQPEERTVMIVDDNHDNLQLASFVAEQQGYRVLLATSAQEVFPQLQQRIDLILLDIVLPDMDGFSVLQQLRQIYQVSPSVPIVAVTALASAQEKRTIVEAGFSGYLSKPYTIDSLEQVLQQPRIAA